MSGNATEADDVAGNYYGRAWSSAYVSHTVSWIYGNLSAVGVGSPCPVLVCRVPLEHSALLMTFVVKPYNVSTAPQDTVMGLASSLVAPSMNAVVP